MVVAKVHHPLSPSGGGTQADEVVQTAAHHFGAELFNFSGGFIRSSQPKNMMSCADQFGDTRRANPARRTGHENSHGSSF